MIIIIIMWVTVFTTENTIWTHGSEQHVIDNFWENLLLQT